MAAFVNFDPSFTNNASYTAPFWPYGEYAEAFEEKRGKEGQPAGKGPPNAQPVTCTLKIGTTTYNPDSYDFGSYQDPMTGVRHYTWKAKFATNLTGQGCECVAKLTDAPDIKQTLTNIEIRAAGPLGGGLVERRPEGDRRAATEPDLLDVDWSKEYQVLDDSLIGASVGFIVIAPSAAGQDRKWKIFPGEVHLDTKKARLKVNLNQFKKAFGSVMLVAATLSGSVVRTPLGLFRVKE